MIPNTPERLSCSLLGSVAVPAQGFRQEGSACSRMPESLFPFLPLCAAQGTAERCVILCDLQELSPDAKQHKQLSHLLPFCTLLRERRSKQDEEEPVLCQDTETWWLHGIWGMRECSSEECITEQEDIPSLALSSLLLAVFGHYAAVWLLRCFPRIPARLCSLCELWPLCTPLPSSTWTALFLDSSDTNSQWNLLISKADTATSIHPLWISWPPDRHCDSYRPVPSFLCSVYQHHKLGLPSCLTLAVALQLPSNFKCSRHPFLSHPQDTMLMWLVLLLLYLYRAEIFCEAFCSPRESASALDHWSIRGVFVILACKI